MLLVGLGNPGRKYEMTRHNLGAIVIQQLYSLILKEDKKLKSLTAKQENHYIILPLTFMNLSGSAVVPALKKYNLTPKEMIVFHDEIELPSGEVKYKFGGGHKGHNGLRHIMQNIGTGDFHRIRLGVGRPDNPKFSVADYVLSKVPSSEIPDVEKVKDLLKDILK